jgi:hypothetical protein
MNSIELPQLFKTSSLEYIHLPIKRNEIRLLQGRINEREALVGKFQSFSLDSPKLPNFQAISYTWGDPVYSNIIDIGGKSLPVLDSLYPFLRYVLDQDTQGSRTWLWIDSLCINQKDDNEKSTQVPLMGKIFSIAQKTYVWLGEEANGSTQAIKFLKWLEDAFWNEECQSPTKQWLAKVAPRDGAYGKDWEAVEKLFSRPWWTRVWTVQEFIIPDKLVLYCGDCSISRSSFRRALQILWQIRNKTLKYDNAWNRNRILEWHKRFGEDENTSSGGLSLIATMTYLGYYQATDPRDRIYSLSGIVKDFELAGMPDYTQPVEILYSKLVKSFVDKYHSLDIICVATILRSDEAELNHTLPSWAPDWRVRGTAMVGPLMVSQSACSWIGNLRPLHSLHCTALYCASLGFKPKANFSSNLQEIICHGLVIDSIDGLAGLPVIRARNFLRQSDDLVQPTSERFSSPSARRLIWRDASDIMESVMRCLTLDRGDHYFNHAIPKNEFSEQFRTLLNMALASSSALNHSFRAWFQANRSLSINKWRLETLSTKWLESGDVIPQSLPYSDELGSFSSRFHDTLIKMSRRLVVTDKGIIAMAPRRTKKDDLICILYGCSVPIVLRKCEDGKSYSFIGECYADGFMNGEVFSMGKDSHKTRSFRIV